MRSHANMVECLKLAKSRISRIGWALSLHLPNGVGGGGASAVEREVGDISDWIDDAIALLEQPQQEA